jgi:hypothetical protein
MASPKRFRSTDVQTGLETSSPSASELGLMDVPGGGPDEDEARRRRDLEDAMRAMGRVYTPSRGPRPVIYGGGRMRASSDE